MVHINFICKDRTPDFANWDKTRFPESEYDICFNSEEDKPWDCVVVQQNLPKKFNFQCRAGNVIYLCTEPPMMQPCPRSFTDQFDKIVVSNPKIRHRNRLLYHGFVTWMMGLNFSTNKERYSFKELASLEPKKTKLISIISSNQRMMPGHNRRMAVIERLQKDYPGVIDVYGKGFHFVDCKADALLPYRFHICIENSTIPYYWTEKFADPILAQCVPIYCGCTNINDFFGEDGYFKFNIDDYKSLKAIIDRIIDNPDMVYKANKVSLEGLRKTLMEKENSIPFVINLAQSNLHNDFMNYNISPLTESKGYKWQLWLLRSKRYVYKRFFKLLYKI